MSNPKRELYFDENTLFEVYDALREVGLVEQKARDAINAIQNRGIVFRKVRDVKPVMRGTDLIRELPHSRACGIEEHNHGPRCHISCPTCGGTLFLKVQQENALRVSSLEGLEPHSVACPIPKHDHGPSCDSSCPTCINRMIEQKEN